jgi:hypothetical protein
MYRNCVEGFRVAVRQAQLDDPIARFANLLIASLGD